MSFLGNNRPDLLKNSNAEPEATPRGSDARFIGEMPAPEPVPSFGSDRYTSAPATNSNDAPLAPDRCANVAWVCITSRSCYRIALRWAACSSI